MATPIMRSRQQTASATAIEAATPGRRRSVLRLLSAESSEEIYPVLLEEILALGFPRALIASADFESAVLRPVAVLNCPRAFQERFQQPLWADNPIVKALHSRQVAVLPLARGRKLLVHPTFYAGTRPCWEAEREHRSDCLLVLNSAGDRKLNLNDQV